MGKLRISIVEFLNTAPLVWGFTDGPLAGKYDLSFAVPSQCAEDLRAGRADIGIIPSIEYQRMDNMVALPGMAIAAKNEVRSLLVISKVPIEMAQSIALDTNSRSTVALARILCRKHWNISPEFVDMPPDADEMLARADAAVVIGDPALRLRLKVDALEAKVPGAEACCCCGDAEDEHPVKGIETLFVVTPEMLADFQASRDFGLAHIGDIAEGAAMKLELPPRELERYLAENIDYSLDEENLAGLRLYYEECAQAGLIPRAREIEFVDEASPVPRKIVRKR